jgi:hypothetical protein
MAEDNVKPSAVDAARKKVERPRIGWWKNCVEIAEEGLEKGLKVGDWKTDVRSKLAHRVVILEPSPQSVLRPLRMAAMTSELCYGSRRV